MTRFDCDAEAELADWAASAGFLDGVGRLLDSGGQLPGSRRKELLLRNRLRLLNC